MTDRVWWRKGAKAESALGSGWKCIAGSLSKISVGPAGVWGLDAKNQVLFRDGTQDDPDDADGSGWTPIDGKFIQISVGSGIVWGLGANTDFFYRSGIDKNTGTHWLRVEQPKDSKVVFKQLEVEGDLIVASDKDNNVYYKIGFNKDLKAGCSATLYNDSNNFDMSNFPSRGSSYKVTSGGWVLYSEPDYQGKMVVHLPGECISNDPVASGEAEYKPWSGPFGSVRPIRGLHYRTLICRIEPEWDKATLRFEREHVETLEHSNDTYETCAAPWPPTLALTTSVSHNFTLQQPQNVPGVDILGNCFSIPNPEPLQFQVRAGADVFSGNEFHSLLSQPFFFETETEASKHTEFKKVETLPRSVLAKTKTVVNVNIFKCTAKVPCKVLLKKGFQANYEVGTEEWTDRAELVSIDRSNIKVEITHQNLNMARKFSAMPANGNGAKSL